MTDANFSKSDFEKNLPFALHELETEAKLALDHLASGTSANWGTVRALAHRLAGTSGTFGFSGLSALASELDEWLTLENYLQFPKPEGVAWLAGWIEMFSRHSSEIGRGMDGQGDPGVAELIRKQAERKARMSRTAESVLDLLMAARSSAGTESESCSISEIVSLSVARVRDVAELKQTRVDWKAGESKGKVRENPLLLELVITESLVEVLRAVRGRGTVEVECESSPVGVRIVGRPAKAGNELLLTNTNRFASEREGVVRLSTKVLPGGELTVCLRWK